MELEKEVNKIMPGVGVALLGVGYCALTNDADISGISSYVANLGMIATQVSDGLGCAAYAVRDKFNQACEFLYGLVGKEELLF